MKKLIAILLIFSAFTVSAQKGKPSYVEDVRLDSNQLKVTIDGIERVQGSVVFPPGGGGGSNLWNYDPVYQSLWSTGAKSGTTQAGLWNFYALPGAGDSATTTAAYNVGIGYGALKNCANCKNNIAFGWEAGKNNKFGQDNVFISEDAGYSLFTGTGNNVVGRGALFSLTRGNKNDVFGYNALQALGKNNAGEIINSLFEENIAIGTYAGAWMNQGHGNIFIGAYAGEMNGEDDGKTIMNSIYIGRYTGTGSAVKIRVS